MQKKRRCFGDDDDDDGRTHRPTKTGRRSSHNGVPQPERQPVDVSAWRFTDERAAAAHVAGGHHRERDGETRDERGHRTITKRDAGLRERTSGVRSVLERPRRVHALHRIEERLETVRDGGREGDGDAEERGGSDGIRGVRTPVEGQREKRECSALGRRI